MQNEPLLPSEVTQNETLPPLASPFKKKGNILERLVDAAGMPPQMPRRSKNPR